MEEDDKNKKSNFFYCGIESGEPSQFFLKKNAMKEGGLNIILIGQSIYKIWLNIRAAL